MENVSVTLADQPGLGAALSQCAKRIGMNPAWLLLRLVWGTLILSPTLIGGKTPRGLRFKFLPLVSLHRVLASRLDAADTRIALAMVLKMAALADTARRFRSIIDEPQVATISAQYQKVFSGPGRHQKVSYEKINEEDFQFAVTDCAFLRVLKELGLEEIAPALCEADVCFWTQVTEGRGVRFSKNEQTLARGGTLCRSNFIRE